LNKKTFLRVVHPLKPLNPYFSKSALTILITISWFVVFLVTNIMTPLTSRGKFLFRSYEDLNALKIIFLTFSPKKN